MVIYLSKKGYCALFVFIISSTVVLISSIVFVLLSPAPSRIVVTQIRGHIAGFPPPPYELRTIRVPGIAFLQEGFSTYFLSSLTCVKLCLPSLGALRSWCLPRRKNSRRRIEPATSTPEDRNDLYIQGNNNKNGVQLTHPAAF